MEVVNPIFAEKISDDHEDGEISDDDDDVPLEIPNKPEILNNVSANYGSSDDEKSPEDIIKAYAKKVEQEKSEKCEKEAVDPKLCKMCEKIEHKYRCPRCDLRTCSLDCSKRHKEQNDCDGVRQPFTKVATLSQYDAQKSIDDQKFMQPMKEKLGLTGNFGNESKHSIEEEKPLDPNALRYQTNSPTERYLLNAARFRHVWLGFTDFSGNESRHEQHSDTIFWNLKLTFKKQNSESGDVEIFEKMVMNIPETIRIVTVLKQFFKPRQYGCIVSECDLDIEKLGPFIQRGLDDVNVYMEVHGNSEKFYGVLSESTILEMTRNRVVADFPKLVITLKDEFIQEMELLSPEELEEIQKKYGGVSNRNERFGGGRGQGGRGFHRGGGGNRGGGGSGGPGGFRKRPGQEDGGNHRGGFKRGRGNGNFHGGNRRGGGGGFQHRNNRQVDTFDPFEPFSGPNCLPMDYAPIP